MRVAEGSYRKFDLGHGTGYYHRLSNPRPMNPRYTDIPQKAKFMLDCDAIAKRWRDSGGPNIDELAGVLGVSSLAVQSLGALWCPSKSCWAFPMFDDRRKMIGFRLRAGDGNKFALEGSHSGVFLPSGLDSKSTLLICEGPSDTAAALTLGFTAIGRPSATGATTIIADMLASMRRRDVVVVADTDNAGIGGGERLMDRIVGLCKSVRRITCRPYKDIREWLNNGATAALVQMRIDNAQIVSPGKHT